MSLTTELDDSGSSTRRFLEERFPNTRRVTGEANALHYQQKSRILGTKKPGQTSDRAN